MNFLRCRHCERFFYEGLDGIVYGDYTVYEVVKTSV